MIENVDQRKRKKKQTVLIHTSYLYMLYEHSKMIKEDKYQQIKYPLYRTTP